ncbi:bestrophin-like domain [Tunturiibacter lichenicola]|uniref:bestrophin-like domain n=1 Tax=Tunturiibacter lichenicola TaxID=2051959 RepID=UPI0021B2906A|nr:hypothetical protein [Edaphobacter lichenicola]
MNYPIAIFFFTFFLLWFAAWVGGRLNKLRHGLEEEERPDFGTVLAATLTLLGLIIGFSFSMATARYDLRKTYEEAEANAIGTEYIRADLLPEPGRAQVRSLLRQYTDQRIAFYNARNWDDLNQIVQSTAKLQDELWTAASKPALAQPTPVIALAVAGMNDVINSQGYTQAAWWNRIPVGAWFLMFGIALFCNLLLGFGSRRVDGRLLLVLPLVVAVSFFLIADIDSPRGGVIQVHPQNLYSLRASVGE